MQLHDFKMAPNARRVRVFVAEKGLDIPMIEVDLASRAQLDDGYRRINPMLEVPALALDNGTVLTESTAICHYLEALHPDPPLCGRDPLERARVMMWDRRVEQHGFFAVSEAFRNGNAFFKDRAVTGPADFAQIPELAERGRQRFAHFLAFMERRLGEAEFVAGERYGIADITAMVTIDFARVIRAGIGEDQPNLRRWYAAVSARPSAQQ